MCGRYVQSNDAAAIAGFHGCLDATDGWQPSPKGEVFPTTTQLVIIAGDEQPQVATASWGTRRPWSKRPIINARDDRLASSRVWKALLEGGQRCLIPVQAWYEWSPVSGQKVALDAQQ